MGQLRVLVLSGVRGGKQREVAEPRLSLSGPVPMAVGGSTDFHALWKCLRDWSVQPYSLVSPVPGLDLRRLLGGGLGVPLV